MCFSATASFVSGVALSAIGVATIKKAKTKEELPLAVVPLLFGIQQIAEGFVWLSFQYSLPTLNVISTYFYSLFAFVLWPMLIPFAVGKLETVPWRKKVILFLQFIGLGVGLYLLYAYGTSPVTSRIVNASIQYDNSRFYFVTVAVGYVAATVLSCLFSSHRLIRVLGFSTLLAGFVAYWMYVMSFASVWCFFSAILSVVIWLYFDREKKSVKAK